MKAHFFHILNIGTAAETKSRNISVAINKVEDVKTSKTAAAFKVVAEASLPAGTIYNNN